MKISQISIRQDGVYLDTVEFFIKSPFLTSLTVFDIPITKDGALSSSVNRKVKNITYQGFQLELANWQFIDNAIYIFDINVILPANFDQKMTTLSNSRFTASDYLIGKSKDKIVIVIDGWEFRIVSLTFLNDVFSRQSNVISLVEKKGGYIQSNQELREYTALRFNQIIIENTGEIKTVEMKYDSFFESPQRIYLSEWYLTINSYVLVKDIKTGKMILDIEQVVLDFPNLYDEHSEPLIFGNVKVFSNFCMIDSGDYLNLNRPRFESYSNYPVEVEKARLEGEYIMFAGILSQRSSNSINWDSEGVFSFILDSDGFIYKLINEKPEIGQYKGLPLLIDKYKAVSSNRKISRVVIIFDENNLLKLGRTSLYKDGSISSNRIYTGEVQNVTINGLRYSVFEIVLNDKGAELRTYIHFPENFGDVKPFEANLLLFGEDGLFEVKAKEKIDSFSMT